MKKFLFSNASHRPGEAAAIDLDPARSASRSRAARPSRRHRSAAVLCVLVLACSGCVSMLMPSSGQLLWALLKPLVGFDPNQVNLFEQPVIKQRMTALLGERYAPAMRVLRTADELRQEGPLFYLVSRYTPIPGALNRAGLVWNRETNQFAALLMKGDVAEVFSEAVPGVATSIVEQTAASVTTNWPTEMRAWLLDPAAAVVAPAAD